jgi:outer membrane protein assembly factor BamD (BamD/ComL family)
MRVRWIKFACATAVCLAFGLTDLRADFSSDVAAASKSVREGVPEVAITRLQSLRVKNLTPEQRRIVADNLVEALIAAKRPADALNLLNENKQAETSAEKFWRAQALAGLSRWAEALPLYQQIAADKRSTFQIEAAFGAAEALRGLNRADEAVQILTLLLREKQWRTRAALRLAALFLEKSDISGAERMLDGIEQETTAERKERRFLRGQLDLAQNHTEHALANFEPLIKKPKDVSHALAIAALFGIADAHLRLKTPESGDDFLEDFIDHHPNDVALPELFAKLDELYRAERKPARAELERWSHEAEQPRRGFAQWYLARIELRAGHRDRALQFLRALQTANAKIPALAGGLFEFARLEMENGNLQQALSIIEEARSWQPAPELLDQLNFLRAQTHYKAGDFQAATTVFEQIGRSDSNLAKLSIYDASLGWLQLGDRGRLAAAYDDLQKHGGDENTRAELRLEEGLLRARQGQKDAVDALQKFIAEFPGNARVSEAWVALAELAFHSTPPRLEEAEKLLGRAMESKPTIAAVERGDYLKIWIEDSASANSDRLIQLANQFLQSHPDSQFTSDVRMKLAEAYYLRQDFSNAQTQFELFAQRNPTAPLTEKALFFAAESSKASMAAHGLDRAIVLFDQVAQMKGELQWAARNEEAVIERKLGKPQDALLLYDDILKNKAKPGEKREALCGKGDIFFDLSTNDPKNYERAIEAYEQLAADASEAGHWHNQALFKKGICLEKKADREGALATFYQVLEGPVRSDRSPEFFWFYKAGFNAARLLESDLRWDSAAKVYEKLVAAGGTRSEEAKIRLNRLRLEHFLWED